MLLAYCGLDCAACPAFHAAERLSMEERQAIADKWAVEFGDTGGAAEIDCVGCTVAGHRCSYCETMCEIRACGSAKRIATCAECPDYGCAALSGFLANVPEAKANLEARRPA